MLVRWRKTLLVLIASVDPPVAGSLGGTLHLQTEYASHLDPQAKVCKWLCDPY